MAIYRQFEEDFAKGRKETNEMATEIGATGWYSAGGKVVAFRFPNPPGPSWRNAKIRGNSSMYAPRAKGDEAVAIRKKMDALSDLGGWELQHRLTGTDNPFMYSTGLRMRSLTIRMGPQGEVILMIPTCDGDQIVKSEAWKPLPEEASMLTIAEAYALHGAIEQAKKAIP